MTKFSVIMILLYSLNSYLIAEPQQWAQRYRFSKGNFKKIIVNKKPCLFIEQNKVVPFSQLIIGFNSIRPSQGELSFLIQIQDNADKKWGKWHTMLEWGKKQKTFLSESDGKTSFAHVRLELEKNCLASGFRLKVCFSNDNSVSLFDSAMLTVVNKEKFKAQPIDQLEKYSSVLIAGIPKISQFCIEHEDNYRICSPTACSMVLNYLMKKNCDVLSFTKSVYDEGLDTYGCWPFNTAALYEHSNQLYNVYPTRLNSFSELHSQLLKGIPVIVSVRGSIEGAPKSYPHGHLLVVIGWDKQHKTVICHDPAALADDEVLHNYSFVDFQRAWELSHRLAYFVQRKSTDLNGIKFERNIV